MSFLSKTPEEYLQFKRRRFHKADLLLRQRVAPIRGRCIELGSGAGYFSMMMTKKDEVSEVVALEVDPETIKKYRPIFQESLIPDLTKMRYEIGDMNKINDGYGTYDTVVFSASLHHSPDKPLSLRVANRLLSMGGVLVLHDEHCYPVFLSPKKRPTTIPYFTRLLKDAGFKPIIFRYIGRGWLKRLIYFSPLRFLNGWVRFSDYQMLGVKVRPCSPNHT